MEAWLLLTDYRKSPALYPMVSSLTLYDLPFSHNTARLEYHSALWFFRVIQGQWFSCHLKANMWFLISDHSIATYRPKPYLEPFSHNTSVTDRRWRTDAYSIAVQRVNNPRYSALYTAVRSIVHYYSISWKTKRVLRALRKAGAESMFLMSIKKESSSRSVDRRRRKRFFPNWVRVLTTTAALVVEERSCWWRPDSSLVNYLRQGGYVFARFCLSVCHTDNSKSYGWIFLKFWGYVGHGISYKWLNFGGDPARTLDSGSIWNFRYHCVKGGIREPLAKRRWWRHLANSFALTGRYLRSPSAFSSLLIWMNERIYVVNTHTHAEKN